MDSTDKKIWYSIAAVALLGIFASEKLALVTSERSISGSLTHKVSYLVYKSGDDEGIKRFKMIDSVNDACDRRQVLGMGGMCVLMGIGVIKRNPHLVVWDDVVDAR